MRSSEYKKSIPQLSIIEKLFLEVKCSFYVVGYHNKHVQFSGNSRSGV